MITRAVNIPSFFHIGRGITDHIKEILQKENIHSTSSVIVSGRNFTQTYGNIVGNNLENDSLRVHIDDNEIRSIKKVEEAVRDFDPTLVIGVGGGKALDVTKFCAHRLDKPFLAMPTSLSNDGISSPISVVHTDHGIRSIGTNPPIGIIVDTDVILKAPRDSLLAGVGDLLSNLSAVEDWNLSNKYTGEKVDKFAEILAKNSAEGFIRHFKGSGNTPLLQDEAMLISLAEGLIQSGIAMSLAGSSRPCSGAEHLISHALDQLLGFSKPHGLQVGLATLFTHALRRKDMSELVKLYEKIGFPTTPNSLGIPLSTFLEAIKIAPKTRSERFTILNVMDETRMREALKIAYE
jgi:glycerol-1-phosphate dehydrogenase [NAD(P)+]